jgi:hypothetical protein
MVLKHLVVFLHKGERLFQVLMEIYKDVPSRVLSHLPHIIEALSRDLHCPLQLLQALIKKCVTAQLLPDFFLQLSSLAGCAFQSGILGTGREIRIGESIMFMAGYRRESDCHNHRHDQDPRGCPEP